MPNRLFFDIESTGLDVKTAEILEFAWIMLNTDTGATDFGQQYFMTDKEVPSGASSANGLTRAKLASLSNGMYFDEFAPTLIQLLKSADSLVGYNIISYDAPLLNNALRREGIDWIRDSGRETAWPLEDVMLMAKDILPRPPYSKGKYYGPKLVRTYAHVAKHAYNMPASNLDAMFTAKTGKEARAHEGLFDVWMTLASYKGLQHLGA